MVRAWCEDAPLESGDEKVLRKAGAPFSADGGMVLVRATWAAP
jgi:hypothetical protein